MVGFEAFFSQAEDAPRGPSVDFFFAEEEAIPLLLERDFAIPDQSIEIGASQVQIMHGFIRGH
jgi:hypothetical protein